MARSHPSRRNRRRAQPAWHPRRLSSRSPIAIAAAICVVVALFAWGAASAASGSTDSKGPSVTNFTKQPWCGEAGQQPVPSPRSRLDRGLRHDTGRGRRCHRAERRLQDDQRQPRRSRARSAGAGAYHGHAVGLRLLRRRSLGGLGARRPNQQVGLYDFVYDRANARVRFASYGVLTPSDARYGHAFPSMASSTAVDRLQAERQSGS